MFIVIHNFVASFIRSAYFQQIEEDVEKHAKTINEMKAALSSFQTKDMSELLKFHQYIELHLEDLTDESQVTSHEIFEKFTGVTTSFNCILQLTMLRNRYWQGLKVSPQRSSKF